LKFKDRAKLLLRMQLNEPGSDEASPAKQTRIESEANQPPYTITFEKMYWEKIYDLENELACKLMAIDYLKGSSVDAVYNPLEYAAEMHANYLKKYLKKAPQVLFLGECDFIVIWRH
jgi:hypothetical protein